MSDAADTLTVLVQGLWPYIIIYDDDSGIF